MSIITVEDFWKNLDKDKLTLKYRLDRSISSVATWPLQKIRLLFREYLLFTEGYIGDLTVLVSRIDDHELKKVLSSILSDEKGNGNSQLAHPELYRQFLLTLGLAASDVNEYRNHRNVRLLNDLSTEVQGGSLAFAIGARGMAGECLCQIYLAALYEAASKNPEFAALKGNLDSRFWEIHLGETDEAHTSATRMSISKLISMPGQEPENFIKGYNRGIKTWDDFWSNAFESAAG